MNEQENTHNFKENNGKKYKVVFTALFFVYGFLAFIGLVFKIMHWPGADLNIIIGFSGLIGHTIGFVIFKKQKTINKILAICSLLFIIVSISNYFNFLINIMEMILTISLITLFVSFLFRK